MKRLLFLALATVSILKGAEMSEKEVVLAGGCFWGTEAYLKQLPGVLHTYTGYANSTIKNPTYEQVSTGNTRAAEAVYVKYDEYVIDLPHLLKYFFYTIDPTSINRQGNDIGSQYRSGIYYIDERDKSEILDFIKEKQKELEHTIAVEVKPLENITKAEEYHQNYLEKNPNGYCHVTFESLPEKGAILSDKKRKMEQLHNYKNQDSSTLKKNLSSLSYEVVKNSATERPFTSELNREKRAGIYVDITNNQPLFASKDKFESGSGWPSFTRPIDSSLLREKNDSSHGMQRIEVRAGLSDSHLGHVFDDGPRESGGMRYCINGAALKFIPKEEMEAQGYGYLLPYLEK
ncbi:MAG: peptide-methionine (R)-S-oxide reductase MsrB [Wolinella sp.]